MSDKLKRIESKDISQIVEIFDNRHPADEFIWLFTPNDRATFNGYVISKTDATIVGVIGYITCAFSYNKEIHPVTIANSWRILDKNKGLNGILLFKKVISEHPNILSIGGSADARKLLPYFKLQSVSTIAYHIKVFSPLKYFFSLNKKPHARLWYFLRILRLPSISAAKGNVKIAPFDFTKPLEKYPLAKDILQHEISSGFLKWMCECPVVEAFCYTISYNSEYLGPCVIYRKLVGKNIYRGRIIYLPYIPDKKAWLEIMSALDKVVNTLHCISVDVMCTNNHFKSVLHKSGFKNLTRKNMPVSIKSEGDLVPLLKEKAHIQFSDGDIGYRNI